MIRPSRFLNEKQGFLGLNTNDLLVIMGVLVVSFHALAFTRFQILSLPLAAMSGLILVPIRLRYRRGIIRDSISFLLSPRRLR